MLYLVSILMYTQAGSVQQETRQVYTINLKRFSHILVIIKQPKETNERENKTS
jgi:ABC-type enterochelin transport system ATPase subunit